MSSEDVIHSDPEILGGTPVFVGNRVPVQNLIAPSRATTPVRAAAAQAE
jgi:uncharacterized protein (DUF433 family)